MEKKRFVINGQFIFHNHKNSKQEKTKGQILAIFFLDTNPKNTFYLSPSNGHMT